MGKLISFLALFLILPYAYPSPGDFTLYIWPKIKSFRNYSSEISYSFPATRYKELPDRSLYLNMPVLNANISIAYFDRIQWLWGFDYFVGKGNNDIILPQYVLNLKSNRNGFYISSGVNVKLFRVNNFCASIETSLKLGYARETLYGNTTVNNVGVPIINSDYSFWNEAIVPKFCLSYNIKKYFGIGISFIYQASRFSSNDRIDYYDGYNFDVPYYNFLGDFPPKDLGCGYSIGIKFIYNFSILNKPKGASMR